MLMSSQEIARSYIYKLSMGEEVDLEEYLEELFKGCSNAKLKQYCKSNSIYLRPRDTDREDIMWKIYGSCNTQVTYNFLGTKSIDGESNQEHYKRIYENM
jgi:hypothetical protein